MRCLWLSLLCFLLLPLSLTEASAITPDWLLDRRPLDDPAAKALVGMDRFHFRMLRERASISFRIATDFYMLHK